MVLPSYRKTGQRQQPLAVLSTTAAAADHTARRATDRKAVLPCYRQQYEQMLMPVQRFFFKHLHIALRPMPPRRTRYSRYSYRYARHRQSLYH